MTGEAWVGMDGGLVAVDVPGFAAYDRDDDLKFPVAVEVGAGRGAGDGAGDGDGEALGVGERGVGRVGVGKGRRRDKWSGGRGLHRGCLGCGGDILRLWLLRNRQMKQERGRAAD